MRLLRLELVLPLVCCVACARPTLDELQEDGGIVAVEEDAGGPADADGAGDEPTEDAGEQLPTERKDAGSPSVTVPVVDAGQADAGDKLPPTLANCAGEPVQTPDTSVGSALIEGVRINGNMEAIANVKAGAAVKIRLSVSFGTCGVFAAKQLYVGLETAENEATCQSRPCSEFAGIVLDVPFDITAPSTPGIHYVLAGLGSSMTFTCDATPSPPSTPVAALCVTD